MIWYNFNYLLLYMELSLYTFFFYILILFEFIYKYHDVMKENIYNTLYIIIWIIQLYKNRILEIIIAFII